MHAIGGVSARFDERPVLGIRFVWVGALCCALAATSVRALAAPPGPPSQHALPQLSTAQPSQHALPYLSKAQTSQHALPYLSTAPPPDEIGGGPVDQARHDRIYTRFFGTHRYARDYSRAAFENTSLLLFELFLYWYEPQSSVVDWQFPDLQTKVTSTEAVRFDNNLTRTNFMLHPTAGGMHYLLTRTNGFGVAPSFVAAAGSSAIYELLLEWREIVSLNDLIVTPFGGLSSGEFMHQFGNYLNSEPEAVRTSVRGTLGSTVRDAARYSGGLPRAVHDALDKPLAPASAGVDNLGLSRAWFHEFRVRVGQQSYFDGEGRVGDLFALRSELQLFAMPGFLRPGDFERWYFEGNYGRFHLRIANGDAGHATELEFGAHLMGYYAQELRSPTDGYAHEFALASELVYVDRKELSGREHYGLVRFPHPAARFWFGLGDARLELAVRASADFASIRSIAFPKYAARFGETGAKSTLQLHGYAHHFGISAGASAELIVGDVAFGGSAEHGHYESIDVLDREQETVFRESHESERMTELEAHFRIEPQGSAVSAQFEAAEVLQDSYLDSALGNFQGASSVRRLSVELGVVF